MIQVGAFEGSVIGPGQSRSGGLQRLAVSRFGTQQLWGIRRMALPLDLLLLDSYALQVSVSLCATEKAESARRLFCSRTLH
jgi:hypothetical protein